MSTPPPPTRSSSFRTKFLVQRSRGSFRRSFRRDFATAFVFRVLERAPARSKKLSRSRGTVPKFTGGNGLFLLLHRFRGPSWRPWISNSRPVQSTLARALPRGAFDARPVRSVELFGVRSGERSVRSADAEGGQITVFSYRVRLSRKRAMFLAGIRVSP